MRFFNLDLHVGVIGDIKQIFQHLGHEVTDWSISAHTWVFNRPIDHVDVVNQHTWKSISPSMCDAFYERYKDDLDQYDAFIVTHTPCFSMLYERWGKPIICVASTRYEQPFSNDRDAWENFNSYLRRKIDEGIIIPVANNKYDADYAKAFTQRVWRVIPSICDYTNAPYTGSLTESLYFSKFGGAPAVPGLTDKRQRFKRGLVSRIAGKLGVRMGQRGYSWQDIAAFKSVVYVPYNASIMSIFEMYTAGIPMLFPSQELARSLFAAHKSEGVFSELSFNQVRGLPPASVIPCDGPDPNAFDDDDIMMHWIAKSDFYDSENMKGIVYFDSFEELGDILPNLDVPSLNRTMKDHGKLRSETIHGLWGEVLDQIAGRGTVSSTKADSRGTTDRST